MPKEKTYALGIDLGGTKVLASVVDITTGEVVTSVRKRTKAEKGQDFISKRTVELARLVLDEAKLPNGAEIVAAGAGAAGQIDRQPGRILDAPNLGVRNLNLAELLGQEVNKPVSVGTDVEVATFGELYYGSGRGYKNFVCVFVGTGIGGCIVQDGHTYPGLTRTAGENGHIPIDSDGRLCGCGQHRLLETHAARPPIPHTT